MPKQLLCDSFDFQIDRAHFTKSLTEARQGSRPFPLAIKGRLSECDKINGNKRRYSKRVWERNLAEGSHLMTQVSMRKAIGLLEHPSDGKVDLLSPISHLTTRVWMEGNIVLGEITLLNTPEGHKLAALIEGGYNPTVSSRGFGSVETAADGVDDVQEDFVCESWDAVYIPSFDSAILDGAPVREALAGTPKAVNESAGAPVWEASVRISSSKPGKATVFVSTDLADDEAEAKRVALRSSKRSSQITADMEPIDITKTEGGWNVNFCCPSCEEALQEEGGDPKLDALAKRMREAGCFKSVSVKYFPGGQPAGQVFAVKNDGTEIRNIRTSDDADAAIAGCKPKQEEALAPSPSGVPAGSQNQPTMDTKLLSESVRALTSTGVSKLDTLSLIEGRARAQELHRSISAAQAASPASAWDCTQMHEALSRHEAAIVEAIEAPRKEVSRLTENTNRTLAVLRTVTETGLSFKRKAATALAESARKAKIVEAVAKRGQGWEKRARLAEARLLAATEALNAQKRTYAEDTLSLGRKLVKLEFKVTDATELKRIDEAVSTDKLADIRDGYKRTLTEAGKPAGAAAPAAGAAAAPKPVAEGAAAPAAAAAAAAPAPVVPAAFAGGNRPFSISESASLAVRLGSAAAV